MPLAAADNVVVIATTNATKSNATAIIAAQQQQQPLAQFEGLPVNHQRVRACLGVGRLGQPGVSRVWGTGDLIPRTHCEQDTPLTFRARDQMLAEG